jgi:hypothetical protein
MESTWMLLELINEFDEVAEWKVNIIFKLLNKGWSCSSEVYHVPHMCVAQGSIFSTTKQKKN